MLRVTYGQLREENFKRGMMKLANCAQLKSPKLAFNVAKICGRFQEEAKLADELYDKLVDQYAKKDEDGKLEPHAGRPGTFWIPDANAGPWKEKLDEYNAIGLDIDRPKLDFEGVSVANLTPLEINALEPLLAFDEDETASPMKLVPGLNPATD